MYWKKITTNFCLNWDVPCNIFFAYQQQATETSTEVGVLRWIYRFDCPIRCLFFRATCLATSPLWKEFALYELSLCEQQFNNLVLRKILRCFIFLSVFSLSLLSPVTMRFVVRLEEQFSVFVAGDHYCTSWRHFDYAWSQTWKKLERWNACNEQWIKWNKLKIQLTSRRKWHQRKKCKSKHWFKFDKSKIR